MMALLGMNPYAILAAVILVIALFTGTYVKGRVDGLKKCQDRIAVLQAEATARAVAEQDKAVEAATKLEAQRVRTEIKYRTITKIVEKLVERPVYRDVCFDDDGLRLVNAALTGSPAPAGQPAHPLPPSSHLE
jgi:hypothetical protein